MTKIDVTPFPAETHAFILAAWQFANIGGETLADREIVERAILLAEKDATKRDGYRGPKAAADAAKSRSIAAQLRAHLSATDPSDAARHFVIFNGGPGAMLQWSGIAADADAAWYDTHDILGDVGRDAYAIVEVSRAEREQIEAWDEAGAPAAEAPDWLDARLDV